MKHCSSMWRKVFNYCPLSPIGFLLHSWTRSSYQVPMVLDRFIMWWCIFILSCINLKNQYDVALKLLKIILIFSFKINFFQRPFLNKIFFSVKADSFFKLIKRYLKLKLKWKGKRFHSWSTYSYVKIWSNWNLFSGKFLLVE